MTGETTTTHIPPNPTRSSPPPPQNDRPEWAAWSWAGGRLEGQRGISWLGVFLVLVGGALFLNQLNHDIDISSLVTLALGIALTAAWLFGGWIAATVPALALTALGVAGLASHLGYLPGEGWTWLALGVALLAAWLLGYAQRRPRMWAMWLGLILTAYGIVRVSPTFIPEVPNMPWLVPLVLVVIGVALLVRRRLEDNRRVGGGARRF